MPNTLYTGWACRAGDVCWASTRLGQTLDFCEYSVRGTLMQPWPDLEWGWLAYLLSVADGIPVRDTSMDAGGRQEGGFDIEHGVELWALGRVSVNT